MPDYPDALLHLVEDQSGAIELNYADRLHYLANELPHPNTQCPAVLTIFGQENTIPVRNLYPELPRHQHHGIANILLHPNTIDSDNPLFVVECSSQNDFEWRRDLESDQEIHKPSGLPIQAHVPSERDNLITLIHAKLLHPFSDVLCVFCDENNGLSSVTARLAAWAAHTAPNSARRSLPRVIVAIRADKNIFEARMSVYISELIAIPRFSDAFCSLKIVNIQGTTKTLLGSLKIAIKNELEVAYLSRKQSCTLFSATHTAAFFDSALRIFTQDPVATFDFFRSSREFNPVAQDFKHHLRTFMRMCLDHHVPRAVGLSYVASTLLLDCFPPGMHRRYLPSKWVRL